jgi:hypothetical protein
LCEFTELQEVPAAQGFHQFAAALAQGIAEV